jgi:hypothetical protein
MKEALCQYHDLACRDCVREILLTRPFKLVNHWDEPGIEIWTYQLDSETLKVSEEYGEMYVEGSENLKNWLLSEVQEKAPRLRYSLTESQEEATRLAEAFFANRPDRDLLRHQGTFPDATAPRLSTGDPVIWIAAFAPALPSKNTLDERVLLAIDIESGAVTVRKH